MVSLVSNTALKTTQQTLKDLFLERDDLPANQKQALTIAISVVGDEITERNHTARIVDQKPTSEYGVVGDLLEQTKL